MEPCSKLQGRKPVIAKNEMIESDCVFLLLRAFALVIYCTASLSAKKPFVFVSKIGGTSQAFLPKILYLGKLAELPLGKLAERPSAQES